MNNKKVATLGETIATEYLIKKGYTILDRNFACKMGEIDIIAKLNNLIVFVEVKARNTEDYGKPFEAVTYSKIQKIIKSAKLYILKNKLFDNDIRFDVISILRDNVEHIERAFDIN